FLYNLHIGPRVHQHGWLHKVAFALQFTSPDNGFSSFGGAAIKIAANPIELFLGYQGPHHRGRIETRTNSNFLGFVGHAFDNLIENALMGKQAGTGTAALSLIKEDGGSASGNCDSHVSVLENDVGRFAAEFQ